MLTQRFWGCVCLSNWSLTQLISNFNLWAPLWYLGHGVVPGPPCGSWAPLWSLDPMVGSQGTLWSLGPLVFSMSPLVPQAPIMVLGLIAHCSSWAPLWSMLLFRVPGPVVIPWSHCDPLHPICSPDSRSHMWVMRSQGHHGLRDLLWPKAPLGFPGPVVVSRPPLWFHNPVWSSFPL